jgi:polyisoprenoid-binding protein YceI
LSEYVVGTAPDTSGLTPGLWTIDPAHSEITFSIRHLMSTVRGSFAEFSGQVEIAEELDKCRAEADIVMASIDTRNAERDAHVRSSEILGTDRFPTMTFETTGVTAGRSGAHAARRRFVVEGDLTICGVTRPVELTAEFQGVSRDPWGATRAGFSAVTRINRGTFGIAFNIPLSGDQVVLGDRIDIQLEIQAVLSE